MIARILFALTLLAVFFRALEPVRSDDFFMYLALGRRYFELGEFGATDPFLFTIPNLPWHEWHEWLSYLLYYQLHQLGGFQAIILLRAVMVSTMAVLVWKSGERMGTPPSVNCLTTLFAFFVATERCMGDRCSAFSDLIVCGLLFALTDSRFTSKASKLKYFLPLVFAVWVQFHPGFLAGWALLFLFALANIWKWDKQELKQWLIVGGLCLLAPLLNPIGIEGLIWPVKTLTADEFKIFEELNSEWATLWGSDELAYAYKFTAISIMSVFAAVILFTSVRSRRWFPALACLILVYFGFSAIRFVSMAGFGLGILAANGMGRWNWGAMRGRIAYAAAAALPIVFTILVLRGEFGPRRFLFGDPVHPAVPVKAAKVLAQLPSGNIFNEYDMGGLLAWELNGRSKIAGHPHIDRPSLVLKNYYRFSYSAKDWDEVIVRNNVEYFITHRRSVLAMPDAGWVQTLVRNWNLIYQDELALVFQRRALKSP